MKYEDAMKLYPDIPGCMDCIYWRMIGWGHLYTGKLEKNRKRDIASSIEPCCHYSLKNHVCKETSEMGYECPYRVERK